MTPEAPVTEAGRALLEGHGHRPVEGDEPGTPDNVWCNADDEPWPCPFAQNLARIEAEAVARDREPGLRAALEGLMAAVQGMADIERHVTDRPGDSAVFTLDEPGPDTPYSALRAAYLTARALLAATPSPAPTDREACWTCKGEGWVSGIGADPLPSGEPGEPYQVQETCPECGGSGSSPAPTPCEHEWEDAPDDEEAWYCPKCGTREEPEQRADETGWLASPAPTAPLDVAWREAEAALISAQGDEDGFGVVIAYWSEFPDAPWSVAANDVQVEAARLPDALQALAARLATPDQRHG